ncbi:MAG: hypothetical protein HKO53_03300 [Gemmatimonadetes bacterium]|nr:hypothetical protein [Gemmatimonadota bacterium]
MQYFVYVTMSPDHPPKGGGGGPPSAEKMAEIAAFHEEATRSGTIVATGRLGQGVTRICGDGDDVTVTDGPFIEGKEVIPGFTLIEADTKKEAIEWAIRYRDLIGMSELRVAEVLGG